NSWNVRGIGKIRKTRSPKRMGHLGTTHGPHRAGSPDGFGCDHHGYTSTAWKSYSYLETCLGPCHYSFNYERASRKIKRRKSFHRSDFRGYPFHQFNNLDA